jgi:hypothetical protein
LNHHLSKEFSSFDNGILHHFKQTKCTMFSLICILAALLMSPILPSAPSFELAIPTALAEGI